MTMKSFAYPSQPKCQWCSRNSDRVQKKKPCLHAICDRCYMKDTSCRSDCPVCWEESMAEFIRVNKICAVCCTGIKITDPSFACPSKHYHCTQCTSEGCLLCQFRELKASNDKTYRDLPANIQHVLYACQIWQSKFEESPLPISKHIKHDTSSTKDDDDSPDMSGSSKSSNLKISSTKKDSTESGDCMVCLDRLSSPVKTLPHCKHSFHQSCIEQWFQSSGKQSCPTCGHVYGVSKGPQPPNGRMLINYLPMPLPGFENAGNGPTQGPTIEITYDFPSGIQGPLNPNPNQPYTGTSRRAYLPNNKEGREILQLLQRAFHDQHIFTIGRSSTTGQDNVVTWNDIHHKTSIHGGPQRFGYPDPTYLLRVRQELAVKGYK